ncbi:9408d2a7-5423-48d9-8220-fde43c6c3150-CDS [Sclerotinia trifoliorum]|uniref:9408d2a7-5423-48d9-8220-fde43c6c3150-CDS n=1 Tax=Sclerotinia trifoliorum TaxID=28548 RepID=A0A8H2VLK6_9HELO|nr:9408d2a7-5423-48d9-8220-fde43c6c3150-CDS [Sclerotinia trifoliorum]
MLQGMLHAGNVDAVVSLLHCHFAELLKVETSNLSQQREDGFWTVGLLEFDVLLTDNQVIGCAAMCNVSYPEAKPGSPLDKVPFPGR